MGFVDVGLFALRRWEMGGLACVKLLRGYAVLVWVIDASRWFGSEKDRV